MRVTFLPLKVGGRATGVGEVQGRKLHMAQSTSAAFHKWEGMWRAGLQPGQAFDAKRCEPAFSALLKAEPARPGMRALVPGCGRGYALGALAEAGYHATGLEIAPSAVTAACDYLRAQQGIEHKWEVQEGDFFTHETVQPYDLIYDCTFLCAIPPEMRSGWADCMDRLLSKDGELVTLIFPIKTPAFEGGPPYCMSPELVRGLLEPRGFSAVALDEVPNEMLARGHIAKEFLGRWRKGR